MNTAHVIEIDPTPRLWTREEYYKMAEAGILCPTERVELIGGRIVTMSPQNSPHFTAIRLVEDVLRKIFGLGYDVRVQGPLDVSPSSQPEPDIAVVPGGIRDYAQAHPTTALLVVEVAESTVRFDRGEKASLYASAGVPEYWVVNLRTQRLEVFRDPVPMTGEPYGYGYRTSAQFVSGDTLTPLANPQGVIQVADMLP
ncbi:MAG: Uma2 family endonuclease [Deltaproteobacteria bacterium]|nr:Uma2 family endonuclease [Deltaproteobacteria bacterium]